MIKHYRVILLLQICVLIASVHCSYSAESNKRSRHAFSILGGLGDVGSNFSVTHPSSWFLGASYSYFESRRFAIVGEIYSQNFKDFSNKDVDIVNTGVQVNIGLNYYPIGTLSDNEVSPFFGIHYITYIGLNSAKEKYENGSGLLESISLMQGISPCIGTKVPVTEALFVNLEVRYDLAIVPTMYKAVFDTDNNFSGYKQDGSLFTQLTGNIGLTVRF